MSFVVKGMVKKIKEGAYWFLLGVTVLLMILIIIWLITKNL